MFVNSARFGHNMQLRSLYLTVQIKATKIVERVEERIRTLNAELIRYREQMKRTPPGTARESIKARAMHLLQQKRT